MSRVLVTGGCGFIGSHLVRNLVARGHDVTVLDDLSTGVHRNVPASSRVHVIIGSVLDARLVAEAARGAHIVIHLAGLVGMRLAVSHRARAYETAVYGTQNVLAATRAARTVLMSSSAVYGLRCSGVMREVEPVSLNECLAADGGVPGYACGKATMEALGREASEQHDQRVLIVRPFNVVGRRQTDAYGMVLPSFVAEARRGAAIRIFGDGKQTRAFSAVETFVNVFCRLVWEARAWTHVPNIVNIGCTRSTSIEALARLVIAELGTSTRVEHVPYDEVFPGRRDVRHRVPDLACLESFVGPVEWPRIQTIVRRFCTTIRGTGELDRASPTGGDVIGMCNGVALPLPAATFD